MSRFDSVLIGDNPFFGVDHLSQERARTKSTTKDFDNAVQVIKYSHDLGVCGIVVSTHPELRNLIENIKTKSDLIDKFEFYPILPYVQGYVTRINEKGVMNTLTEILDPAGIGNKMKLITRSGLGILKKDLFELFKVFIDIELLQLKNTKMNTVFLHDVVTDLALSLNMKNIFETFQQHLHHNYDVKAGLVTKNFPLLVTKLNEWDIQIPYIMTSFNKIGFQMNPSRQECEKYLEAYNGNVIAMSILAGGYLKPKEAYDYILSFPQIKKTVVGVSTIEHAKETFELFLKKDI